MLTRATAANKTSSSISRHDHASDVTTVFQRKETDNDAESLSRLLVRVQPKLRVSSPDDPQEKEADRMADMAIMSSPNSEDIRQGPDDQRRENKVQPIFRQTSQGASGKD
ncbi:MAG: hypothetical protein V2B20_14475, partial [Pseudomonadota bacterium]